MPAVTPDTDAGGNVSPNPFLVDGDQLGKLLDVLIFLSDAHFLFDCLPPPPHICVLTLYRAASECALPVIFVREVGC